MQLHRHTGRLGNLVVLVSVQGWYIVTYGLGIYLLNLLLAFLSPKIDPAMMDDEEDNEGGHMTCT